MVYGDKHSTRQAGEGVYGFGAPVYGYVHMYSGADLPTREATAI